MKNNTAAVVVTYNRKEILKRNIECLLGQQDKKCDILIIDNASTDGTAEMIQEHFSVPQVIYFNSGKNLGGAGGFEYGIRKALEYHYDYIWIMDDDTWPQQDALQKLFEADSELSGNWGFLSSAVYWTDGSLCKANKPKKNLFAFVSIKDMGEQLCKIQMGSFVSMLVKADIVREVGLPHGDYFIWTDDYEFSGRISKKYRCYFVPQSHVIHAMKNNTKADIVTDDLSRLNRYECLYRNDVHCYRQYGLQGWMYIWMKDMYTTLKVLLKSKDSKYRRIHTIWQGYQNGLSYHPEN